MVILYYYFGRSDNDLIVILIVKMLLFLHQSRVHNKDKEQLNDANDPHTCGLF